MNTQHMKNRIEQITKGESMSDSDIVLNSLATAGGTITPQELKLYRMNEAKAKKALNNLTRYNGVVMTKAEFVETLKKQRYTSREGEKPSIQFNRIKYNRMTDWREQEEYMKKCDTMIKDYRLYEAGSESVYFEVSKTEFDYFNSL